MIGIGVLSRIANQFSRSTETAFPYTFRTAALELPDTSGRSSVRSPETGHASHLHPMS